MTTNRPILRPATRAPVRPPKRRRFLPLLSLGVSIAALLVAMDARNRALRVNQRVTAARAGVESVVLQTNQAYTSLRQDTAEARHDVQRCHTRMGLVVAAVEAVAATQPGRSRAPYWLNLAKADGGLDE